MAEKQNADEARWIVAARTRPAAFAPVYERYVERIYAYCARRASPTEAEDLTSLVFARALAAVHDYRGGSVAAWLFRIAHNVVVNHYRDRHPSLALDDADSPQPGPLDRLIAADEQRLIRRLIDELPAEQQNLLSLKLSAGLTSAEIGVVLGKSAGAVRVELHRIIQGLRARLRAEEVRLDETRP
ncbi:MAG: sigma-70 family RNA polymerase sigma factor [Anaerolineae bacterium]|nr:sigma-70 family RNA polymerase sigma factor [Anaerolineae bacterium]